MLYALFSTFFDNAQKEALRCTDIHVHQAVKQTCSRFKVLFLSRLSVDAQGRLDPKAVTKELHHALNETRRWLAVHGWPLGEVNEAELSFHFPELSAIDWVWILNRFTLIYTTFLESKPHLAVGRITHPNWLLPIVCQSFARVARSMAYRNVVQDEPLIQEAINKIHDFSEEVVKKLLIRYWQHWQRPPYSQNLSKLNTIVSRLEANLNLAKEYGFDGEWKEIVEVAGSDWLLNQMEFEIRQGKLTIALVQSNLNHETSVLASQNITIVIPLFRTTL